MPDISEPIRRRVEAQKLETHKRVQQKHPKEQAGKDKFKEILKNIEDENQDEGQQQEGKGDGAKPGTAKKRPGDPLAALGGPAPGINWVRESPESAPDPNAKRGRVIDEKA